MSPNAGVIRLIVLEIIRPLTMLATIDFQINNFTALSVEILDDVQLSTTRISPPLNILKSFLQFDLVNDVFLNVIIHELK